MKRNLENEEKKWKELIQAKDKKISDLEDNIQELKYMEFNN